MEFPRGKNVTSSGDRDLSCWVLVHMTSDTDTWLSADPAEKEEKKEGDVGRSPRGQLLRIINEDTPRGDTLVKVQKSQLPFLQFPHTLERHRNY